MKKLRLSLLSLVVVGSLSAIEFEDYAKGVVDQYGNNMWHVLADGCDKTCYKDYLQILNRITMTDEDEELLALLASQRNNADCSPIDIAVARWATHEDKQCASVMKMINAWKIMDQKGLRSKKRSPFEMFLEVDGEDKIKNEN